MAGQQQQQQQQQQQRAACVSCRALLATCLFSLLWRCSDAHGMMIKPAARNWLAYVNHNYYWPDGMNAGGYKLVGDFGAQRWPAARYTLCGDPHNDNRKQFMTAGPIQAMYKAGDTITIDVVVTTNHFGRFTFRLCPARATRMDECELLERADGKGPSWDLPAIAQGRSFNGGAVGASALRPVETDNSFTWYPLPKVNCKWWSGCFQYTGLPVYSLKYKLPKGRTCERCILHWHYLTGHKCVVPCLKSDKYYPNCKANPKYAGTYLTNTPYCGEPGASNPELFWNCADIKITS